MTYGAKVSQPGFNVLSTPDQNLVFADYFTNFKIYQVLTCTVTLTGTDTTGVNTVANPLPYAPVHFAFVQDSVAEDKWRAATMGNGSIIFDNAGDPDWGAVAVELTGTNDFACYIAHYGTGTRTFTFRIIVFVDVFTGTGSALATPDTSGLKVSKAGNDVLTANAAQLQVTNIYPNLTVNATGTINDNSGVVSFHHGFGYKPIYLVFFVYAGVSNPVPASGSFTGGGSTHLEAWIDNNDLYMDCFTGETLTSYFRYIVFNERII
jgi:hypothetical protein